MEIDFEKGAGLVPVIVQDDVTDKVLMLAYMNKEALEKTISEKELTFFSRSKKKLWKKGETSGNILKLISIHNDCDNDTLLIKAIPAGPTCHTGADTCFKEYNKYSKFAIIRELEVVIDKRKNEMPDKSYTADLFRQGINKIAQKLGEESIETIIEAKDNNDELFLNEAADLMFHFLILLSAKNKTLEDVTNVLEQRFKHK